MLDALPYLATYPYGCTEQRVSRTRAEVAHFQAQYPVRIAELREMVEGVSEEVYVASLDGRLRDNLADSCAKAGVIVGDDELDAVETAAAQSEQEVLPGGAAFPVGHVDGQDLAAPVPVDPHRNQHRLAADHRALPLATPAL